MTTGGQRSVFLCKILNVDGRQGGQQGSLGPEREGGREGEKERGAGEGDVEVMMRTCPSTHDASKAVLYCRGYLCRNTLQHLAEFFSAATRMSTADCWLSMVDGSPVKITAHHAKRSPVSHPVERRFISFRNAKAQQWRNTHLFFFFHPFLLFSSFFGSFSPFFNLFFIFFSFLPPVSDSLVVQRCWRVRA